MMASYKILGQQIISATGTDTLLYTCPSSTVVSTLFVCNPTGGAATFRVRVVKSSDASNGKQYIYHNLSLNAAETLACTAGITMSQGDTVVVQSNTVGVVFNLFGAEGA